MPKEAMYRLFAILAVIAELGTLAILVVGVWAKFSESGRAKWAALKDGLGPIAPWLAWAVATTCMAGSLYLSETAKLPPCRLCWVQRGFMYPQALLLLIAAIVKNRRLYAFCAAASAIGLLVATYHYLYERFPDSVSTVCEESVPCSTVWIWEFRYLSIPAMAWSGFAFIMALLAVSNGYLNGHKERQIS